MRTSVAALVMAMILIVSCQPYEVTAGTITNRCLDVAKDLPPASRAQGKIVLAEQLKWIRKFRAKNGHN